MSENKKDPHFLVKCIGPLSVKSGQEVTLAGAIIPRDGQQGGKIKFIDLAVPALNQLYKIGGPTRAFTEIITAIAEGQNLDDYHVGRFFILYERFKHKHGLKTGKEVIDKMNLLLQKENGDSLFKITHGQRREKQPLPFYIRNLLAHLGERKEGCSKEELFKSIELLEKWLSYVDEGNMTT